MTKGTQQDIINDLVAALERALTDLSKFQYPDPIAPSNEWVSETRRNGYAALAKAKAGAQ